MTGQATAPISPLRRALTLWGLAIALMWIVLIADWITPGHLTAWGIRARQPEGLLPGIVTAPFLHANTAHLVANMFPLAVMGTVAALRDWRALWTALGAILVVSGLGVWLTAPTGSVTVGASGIVFGLFGYLIGRGVFQRRLGDILIAVVLVLVYGSLVWGIFPTHPGISWQAHLFGFAAGLASAYAIARRATTGR